MPHAIVRRRCLRIVFALAASCACVHLFAEEPASIRFPVELIVDAGNHDRVDAVVSFSLGNAKVDTLKLAVIELAEGKETPVASQFDSHRQLLLWVAPGAMPAGTKRNYRLEVGTQPTAPQISMADSERTVEAKFQGKSLLQYNKAHVEVPKGINPLYGRSAHIHPVRTPKGSIVTDEFPPDHLHQSGIFFAFTKTVFDGVPIDFWNLAGGKGRVRFKKLNSVASGPVFGHLQTEHEHVATTGEQKEAKEAIDLVTGGKVVLNETWDVRLWTAGWDSGYWLLDIHSRVSCATDQPLKLPQYHYGGMAIRAARSWEAPLPSFITSEGADRMQGNHSRPRWCEIVGPIDKETAGITMMTHPSNFRFPEPLRIHPTMPYMVYTPSFVGDWEIRPDMPHESRYRFLIHDGELPFETIERIWQDYAEPLTAVIRSTR